MIIIHLSFAYAIVPRRCIDIFLIAWKPKKYIYYSWKSSSWTKSCRCRLIHVDNTSSNHTSPALHYTFMHIHRDELYIFRFYDAYRPMTATEFMFVLANWFCWCADARPHKSRWILSNNKITTKCENLDVFTTVPGDVLQKIDSRLK